MTHILIIDDEPHIRDTLRKLLSRFCPQVEVVCEAKGVADGIIAIQKLHPDLVLLDINLGDGTCFDLLQSLDTIDFNIVFMSAFDKDNIQAFKLSSVEFLQKPINPQEFLTVVKNAEKGDPRDLALKLHALAANFRR